MRERPSMAKQTKVLRNLGRPAYWKWSTHLAHILNTSLRDIGQRMPGERCAASSAKRPPDRGANTTFALANHPKTYGFRIRRKKAAELPGLRCLAVRSSRRANYGSIRRFGPSPGGDTGTIKKIADGQL